MVLVVWYHYNLKIRSYGMIASEVNIHQSLDEIDTRYYRPPYDHQLKDKPTSYTRPREKLTT